MPADVVVLCGSLGSTAAMWDPQEPALRGSATVRVDHPGHGGTPVEPFDGVQGLAQRLLHAVRQPRFALVGLSLGAAVAIEAALAAPERVSRLVLACCSPRFGDAEGWRDRAATVRAEGLEPIADAVLGRWFAPGFPARDRYRSMFVSTSPEGYARCCDALAEWHAGERLARLRAPTLVVAGSDDPTSPPAHAHALVEALPDARVAVIEGARHLANVEYPDDFNRLLEEHLR